MLAVSPSFAPSAKNSTFATAPSTSEAEALSVIGTPARSTLLFAGLVNATIGGDCPRTTILMVSASESVGRPLSVTRTVTLLVAGALPGGGVQLKRPLARLMLAPAGAPESRLKVSVFAGRSESV